MPEPANQLTEKEKDALRLLLAGYDAKSGARELDISVHTLNDRLRSARRKLGVTSGKEAARILADADQKTPQNLVRKPLGVWESEENQDDLNAADRSQGELFHLATRRKGILIMSITLALSLAALAVVPSQAPSSSEAVSAPARPSASELQARRWLGLVDFGKFDESYQEAGQTFRDQYALERYKFGLTLVMNKGKVKNRSLATVTRTDEFKGRDGTAFEIVTFDSVFEHANRQTERVVLEKVGSQWKVADYEIVPQDGDEQGNVGRALRAPGPVL
ncbi:helix-turn-helix domain-containing protein [Erythrobacter rubeus]|uniref:DUF4019 domain-containing protein n=1 Tax=Erythrobacter rubeus TaxID=2760803 RepID=A0ABR8KU39_9SPHN|nr:DUF4019 domain-containing protein [Erythrobacter rubeus]MBD2841651.1 DUF4019 domain-containing protein [Erythrobacter rubeus]